jgi:hypothetical protein
MLNFIVGHQGSRCTLENKKNNTILVVIDRFTEIVNCFVVTDMIDTQSLA